MAVALDAFAPAQATPATTIIDAPLISFGREICGDLAAGLRREWLVTNGLGSYASSTLAGVNTRRYHGLLVAALNPPVERTVLVGGLIEWANYQDRRHALSTHEYSNGYVDQHGYCNLQSFALEGMLPVWTFALGGALIEKRLWMADGANTTYISYRVVRVVRPLDLDITPLITYRDFHTLTSGQGWWPKVEAEPRGAVVHAFADARPFWLRAESGRFTPSGVWYWDFYHREETARGLDNRSDLYAPGAFSVRLEPGATFTLVLSTEPDPEMDSARALHAAQERQRVLLERADAVNSHPAVQQLVLAADQFIVQREHSKSVIAGYHWFNDWGRDTMIALPGLTLSTGRPADATGILHTFARYVTDGLLPNNFPDSAGVIPGYNTVDATLWYVQAIRAYWAATKRVRRWSRLISKRCGKRRNNDNPTKHTARRGSTTLPGWLGARRLRRERAERRLRPELAGLVRCLPGGAQSGPAARHIAYARAAQPAAQAV
jgi:predicted glycogen debranching enzyme